MPLPNTALDDLTNKMEPCATDLLLQTLRQNNDYRKREEKMNRDILSYRPLDDNTIYTIPVVFHIVSENPALIPDAAILNALQDLNDAFSKSGAYAGSSGADTRIRFCLAKKDPDGGITDGITRTTSFFSSHSNTIIEDTRLKNLVQWDASQYVNIWYIASMHYEIFPKFQCGQWARLNAGGYATFPPGGGLTDGIVVTGFGRMLAHEMGHYLGLYHTFEGLSCQNSDCSVDGDKVCDTPPDMTITSNCSSPTNSCSSDTLSGFTTDVFDRLKNFMDYGNESCSDEFTEGQAIRMRAVIATQRPGLLADKCTPPCSETIKAGFIRSNPYPLPSDLIHFTNTSSGAANYQWLINNVVVATTPNFSHAFSAAGKYKITLKAFNNPACIASYTDFVIVTCGVTARFYTDKREIASKTGIGLDSIQFTNTSENANSYQWIMSNNAGMQEQVISTNANLTYVFQNPALYSVKLVATKSGCSDTTQTFTIPVNDPTSDGALYLSNAECYQDTKVQISFFVCNNGYIPVPRNMPVSFYDKDPKLGTANKIGTTFYLPDPIPGFCCGYLYSHIIDVGYRGLNTIYAVLNDSGNTKPLKLPGTNLIEKDYLNNIGSLRNFAFKISPVPSSAIMEWGDTLKLSAQAGPGSIAFYTWSSPAHLSCTNCQSPFFVADSSIVKRVSAISSLGCTDTAYVDIKVPPYNDFTARINEIQCSRNDSLFVNFTVFNQFKRGILPKNLMVSFYKGDPATGSAVLLKPTFALTDTILARQSSFSLFIEGMDPGNLYIVVNDSAKGVPISFPTTILFEKSYANNISATAYKPETVSVQPADTTVYRKQFLPLKINTPIYNPSSTIWSTGSSYTLSCTGCESPTAQVFDHSSIQVQTENKYGCLITGTSNIKIFPPDMRVQILDTKCFTNNTALVQFSICMNNEYDSVFARIPVSFYDGNPGTGSRRLLQPVFYTPRLQAGQCYTYTTTIQAPSGNQLFAVINDKGNSSGTFPTKVFDETDVTNNIDDTTYTKFKTTIYPSDTIIQRLISLALLPKAEGGTISSYSWTPGQFLSCTSCSTPVVTPEFTKQYELITRNEFACTDTAIAIIRTHSGSGLQIPNAFTPNADRLNDVFYILTGPDARLLKNFSIFDRWGQKIFEVQNAAPNDPSSGWDGKIKGREAPSGTYVYYVTMAYANGKQEVHKGLVVLIR